MHQRLIARLVSPMAYSALYVFVLLGLGLTVALLERHFGLHTVVRTGDVELVVGLVLVGIPLFLWGARRLYGMFARVRPTLIDHLCHCALLYAVLLGAIVWLPMHYAQLGHGLQYGLVAIASVVAALGVVVDALVLRRHARP